MTVRSLRSWLHSEGQIIREHRSALGTRGVLLERLKTHAGLAGVDTTVARAVWAHEERFGALAAHITALECDLAETRAQLWETQERLHDADATAQRAEHLAEFDATERVAATTFDADDVLVSVILPTFARPEYLRRAVTSVLGQLHTNLELLVVDAGGRPGTAEVLATFTDPRLRAFESLGAPSGRARNRALDEARGDVVLYLDDDNVMLPWWARAVATTARARPDADVFYGARVFEAPPGSAAHTMFERFATEDLLIRNPLDTNVLAHRRSAGARWTDEPDRATDWDLLTSLVAAGHEPLGIPVRAVVYTTSAPDRICDGDDFAERVARSQAYAREMLS